MKKAILTFLVILCLISNTALAEIKVFDENFSIRSGIQYGMTLAEAKTIEDKNGVECLEYNLFSMNPGDLQYRNISIAGIPQSRLTYSSDDFPYDTYEDLFDISSEDIENYWKTTLVEMIQYEFGCCDSAEQSKTVFLTINESLTQKYGEPFCADIYSRLPISIEAQILKNYNDRSWATKYPIIGFAEWLVQYADCYVLVSEIATKSGCYLIYRFVSYEEMETLSTNLLEIQNQIENELANDL